MPGAQSHSAIIASDVTHEPSLSSPASAGQLPLGFWMRKRNSRARCTSYDRDLRARAARHEGSSVACLELVLVAHLPDESCLRICSSSMRPHSVSSEVT